MRTLLASISYEPIQRLGPLSPHGIGTALGFLLGAVLMARRAEPRGIPRQETYNAVTWGAVGAIIGARGFYVLGHLDQFDGIGDVLAVWEGGLTMFGGFVGGLLLGLGYLFRRGYDLRKAVDAAAPGFVVGVIVGRLGDIVIADHLGQPTDFFLGYRIPDCAPQCLAPGYGPPTYVAGAVVHNTALYDLFGALLLAGALALLARRTPRDGTLFAVFSLWYGLQRFLIDFTRNREVIESFFYGLSGSQWAGLAFAVGGAVGLGWIQSRPPIETELPPVMPWSEAPEAGPPIPAVPEGERAEEPAAADAPVPEPAQEPPAGPAPDAAAPVLPVQEPVEEPVEEPPAEEEPPPSPAPDAAAASLADHETRERAAEAVEDREAAEPPAAEERTVAVTPPEPVQPEAAHPEPWQAAPAPQDLPPVEPEPSRPEGAAYAEEVAAQEAAPPEQDRPQEPEDRPASET